MLPDFVRETFAPATDCGGEEGADGRALRYPEWVRDPEPDDTWVEAVYVIAPREAAGGIRTVIDRHRVGIFARPVDHSRPVR